MASRIVEFFGFSPEDHTEAALNARRSRNCPFLGKECIKTLSDGEISGVCTLQPAKSGPVISCPIRLYAADYQILRDIAETVFPPGLSLVAGDTIDSKTGECIAVFGKGWGKELRLPSRGKSGSYSVDWVLAHRGLEGELLSFVAVEVQSIDTTGNYRSERAACLENVEFKGKSSAGFNWENVNKRILPQVIYKGHVLRQEPLCLKGMFFVCPTPVYTKIDERLGGKLRPYPLQPGALTIFWYDVGDKKAGRPRDLVKQGQFTTTIDQVALAFTAPSNLPPPKVYELAISAFLRPGHH